LLGKASPLKLCPDNSAMSKPGNGSAWVGVANLLCRLAAGATRLIPSAA